MRIGRRRSATDDGSQRSRDRHRSNDDQLARKSDRDKGNSFALSIRPPLPVLCRPGGISGEPVPDPIPNSAVKLPSADGTKSQDLEEEVAARPAKGARLFMIHSCQTAAGIPRRVFIAPAS